MNVNITALYVQALEAKITKMTADKNRLRSALQTTLMMAMAYAIQAGVKDVEQKNWLEIARVVLAETEADYE